MRISDSCLQGLEVIGTKFLPSVGPFVLYQGGGTDPLLPGISPRRSAEQSSVTFIPLLAKHPDVLVL